MVNIGAVIKPIVNFVRPMIGNGILKEHGCMTKIVESKKNTKVAMDEPLSSDIRLKELWILENAVFCQLGFYTFGAFA
jgi:hypothetical protein